MLDRSIPRMNNEIINNDNDIGRVTSGSFSPTLGVGIGFGYIDINFAQAEKQLDIKIRDKLHPANIVNKSFIQTL
jgi:aminomethyltransferase